MKILTYDSIPVTEYLRQKDIDLFKDQVAALSPVLMRLREKDQFFPTEPRARLVMLLDECNTLRKQSQKLLDREQGTFRLTAAANPKSTWECAKRDEAFLLRCQLNQHQGAFEAALAVANMVSAAANAKHVSGRAYDEELNRYLTATRGSIETVLSTKLSQPDDLLSKSRQVLRIRNEVLMPRDVGITTPSREVLNFLDDLLGFAAGVLEATEDAMAPKQPQRGRARSFASLRSRRS